MDVDPSGLLRYLGPDANPFSGSPGAASRRLGGTWEAHLVSPALPMSSVTEEPLWKNTRAGEQLERKEKNAKILAEDFIVKRG